MKKKISQELELNVDESSFHGWKDIEIKRFEHKRQQLFGDDIKRPQGGTSEKSEEVRYNIYLYVYNIIYLYIYLLQKLKH